MFTTTSLYRRTATGITATLGIALAISAPASANPFKKLGKMFEKVEREAEKAERSADQVSRTVDAIGRVASSTGIVGEDAANDTDAEEAQDADAQYAQQGYAAGDHDAGNEGDYDASGDGAGDAASGGYAPSDAGQDWSQADASGGYAYDAPREEWAGTFRTNHGELRLIQIGRRVYGDYASRGYFEGCTHDDGMTLRGTFQYNSPRRRHGFIEFRLDGDGFLGTWTWTGSGVPQPGSAINWRGARSAAIAPSLTYVDGSRPHFADNWAGLSDAQREWVLGSKYYDSCDPPEVDYDP